MSRRVRGWSLRVWRPGRGESRSIELGPLAVGLVLLGPALGALVVGVAGGRLWEGAREDGRVARLETRLAGLEGERERLRRLASRLQSIETDYAQIRRALGGEVAASGRDVALPALPGAGGGRGAGEGPAGSERPWAWPVAQPGFVTRSFGSPVDGARAAHPGLDIAVPVGSYVRATAPGVVVEAGRRDVYGFYVRIAHGDGLSSLYAHNSWVFVTPGEAVERLQVIAVSGSTGRSTAPHLHFEVGRGGEAIDPLRYVGR